MANLKRTDVHLSLWPKELEFLKSKAAEENLTVANYIRSCINDRFAADDPYRDQETFSVQLTEQTFVRKDSRPGA